MTMDVRYGGSPADYPLYATERLRAEYLVEGCFRPGEVRFTYTHIDRMIVGGAKRKFMSEFTFMEVPKLASH